MPQCACIMRVHVMCTCSSEMVLPLEGSALPAALHAKECVCAHTQPAHARSRLLPLPSLPCLHSLSQPRRAFQKVYPIRAGASHLQGKLCQICRPLYFLPAARLSHAKPAPADWSPEHTLSLAPYLYLVFTIACMWSTSDWLTWQELILMLSISEKSGVHVSETGGACEAGGAQQSGINGPGRECTRAGRRRIGMASAKHHPPCNVALHKCRFVSNAHQRAKGCTG